MSSGSLAKLNLISGATGMAFSEENRRMVVVQLNHKAATAAGIGALAIRAIETGNRAALEDIVDLAEALAEELRHLAMLAGQFAHAQTA